MRDDFGIVKDNLIHHKGVIGVVACEGKEKGFPVGVGEQTFVAANGVDSIAAEFRGLLDSEDHAVIDFVITGGTGRFEDAEGEFVAEADVVRSRHL